LALRKKIGCAEAESLKAYSWAMPCLLAHRGIVVIRRGKLHLTKRPFAANDSAKPAAMFMPKNVMQTAPAFVGVILLLAAASNLQAGEAPTRREWAIDGVVREALVYAPAQAKTEATPVIFAFHGHGGNMHSAARGFGYHTLWPQAIVVYPQGLNTPGKLTDPGGKLPGWQFGVGDQEDRDLKFFDAILASLKQDYRADDKRLFATGHSNGGAFTYLLWAARGDRFAAVAPSGSAAGALFPALKPKPVLHAAGDSDPLVKFAWQKQTMDELRRLNQCGEGQPWEKWCTLYPSKIGAPVVTLIYPGGHQPPHEVPEIIVKFFKEHANNNRAGSPQDSATKR
jgi:polyhydroxybutyrate depolymerase